MTSRPVSKNCKIDPRAVEQCYGHLLAEHPIIIHVNFHFSPEKTFRLSILHGALNMVHLRRSVQMVHAEGIYVADNCTDKKGLIIKNKLIHHCILYFEKMPSGQPLFSLILHQPGGDSYIKHNLKRNKNDIYTVDFFDE